MKKKEKGKLIMSFDPKISEALKMDNKSWSVGEGEIRVLTHSGAVYAVTDDGVVTGGSRDIKSGRLSGSVYRGGGPIRSGQIVEGLSMEIHLEEKTLITSYVEKIYRLEEIVEVL